MALIALPCQGKPVHPPLTLAYVATLLEQRRHIVRVYDLGLDPEVNLEFAFQPLRSFRPQVVIVSGDQPDVIATAVDILHRDKYAQVLPVPMSRSGVDASTVCNEVLQWLDQQAGGEPGRTPTLTIDQLPLPARHLLLSLESYNLRATRGELQTTLLVGALEANGRFVLRSPTGIVAELRSVSHEFGLRHYLIADVPLTLDRAWLVELLTRLCDAKLGIGWEAIAQPEQLDAELIAHMARAGCEILGFQLDAVNVFESTAARQALQKAVTSARQNGIFVQATLKLEPPYESIPHLVDVAATFGLDAVRFDVAGGEAASVGAIAQKIYDQGRERQRLINRFGAALGGLIWHLRGPRAVGVIDDEG